MADESKPVGTILIADDEPQIRAMVVAALKPLGYRMIEAHDGEEAVKLARSERPIVLVSDVMMPNLNGWEAVRTLRRDPAFANLCVVMLTGVGELANELTSPQFGADECLNKPFDFDVLLQTVRALLARRKV